MLFLGYFAILIHDPVPNESKELCILSHTSVAASAETSIVRFMRFYPTKPHLEGGNCYTDKLLVSHYLRIPVISTLNALTDNDIGIYHNSRPTIIIIYGTDWSYWYNIFFLLS